MQEITHDLARLTNVTAQLCDHVSRLSHRAEDMAAKLGCPIAETEAAVTKKPLRRRNFKDALEAVLETRERIVQVEKLMVTMANAMQARQAAGNPLEPEGEDSQGQTKHERD